MKEAQWLGGRDDIARGHRGDLWNLPLLQDMPSDFDWANADCFPGAGAHSPGD